MRRSAWEILWGGAATLASPLAGPWLRHRVSRGKEIAARLGERRGIDPTPRPPGPLVWFHAASVGETMAILPVLSSLTARNGKVTILLTTGTVTSAALLEQRLPALGLSGVLHRFVPLDVPAWAGRFLDHWRPGAACFVESELWPNLLAACRTRAIPAMLVNARLSARSTTTWGYAPGFARSVLGGFARIHARGPEDAARFRALGAPGVEIAGDLKRAAPALPADPAVLEALSGLLSARPVWLAASTHPGEEPLIQRVHEALAPSFPGLLTIIAPRHPERGEALAGMLTAPRRALGLGPPPEAGIWIADTMGEMGLWYRLAQVAVVGRSLVGAGGGQNPLEPARLGCAIAVGPFTANFSEQVALLREAGALEIVADAPALTRFVAAMLADPAARAAMGERARKAIGAPETLVEDTAQAVLGLLG